jgi:ubiquinone/menaquinone biosynthesis C-methylase UbiE
LRNRQSIAKHIVERGFRVVGVDQSNKLLEIAKTVVPEAEFIHSDMVEIQFAEKFAAAVAWDSVFTSSESIIQLFIVTSPTLLNRAENYCCR